MRACENIRAKIQHLLAIGPLQQPHYHYPTWKLIISFAVGSMFLIHLIKHSDFKIYSTVCLHMCTMVAFFWAIRIEFMNTKKNGGRNIKFFVAYVFFSEFVLLLWLLCWVFVVLIFFRCGIVLYAFIIQHNIQSAYQSCGFEKKSFKCICTLHTHFVVVRVEMR